MRPYLVCLSWESFTPKLANSLVRVLLVVVPLFVEALGWCQTDKTWTAPQAKIEIKANA